ncbi:hypothetical protein EVAR_75654_1 [Eumeta japonica]|uniref:Uncharacterized protein n=1 Tax=Eumeta variegata TaxID=151549 RepID=A0A4C1U037_EUMVA|nr:hypothetical protein EVAR_75654_1 [Eumeta japonica]
MTPGTRARGRPGSRPDLWGGRSWNPRDSYVVDQLQHYVTCRNCSDNPQSKTEPELRSRARPISVESTARLGDIKERQELTAKRSVINARLHTTVANCCGSAAGRAARVHAPHRTRHAPPHRPDDAHVLKTSVQAFSDRRHRAAEKNLSALYGDTTTRRDLAPASPRSDKQRNRRSVLFPSLGAERRASAAAPLGASLGPGPRARC